MSRSKRRSDNLAPALFPFLAVLLCTIGALVLILALTVTNSHASARREAELTLLAVKDQKNVVQVVSDELQIQREEIKKQIELHRKELENIEDHIARLNEELETLQNKMNSIGEQKDSTDSELALKKERITSLQTEIDAKKKELADQIEKQKKKKPAFAIIPYSGRSGTSRRPIYIECTQDGIILQPEGIRLRNQDLIPPGPGNPLATALRLMRSAYAEVDSKYGMSQPPYPLLVVRPDGIESYARAREAMAGWDDQFGYELIDQNMELAFPPSMSGLKESLEQAIVVAKQRQQALLAANPRLARQYELSQDSWDDSSTASASSIDPKFGTPTGTTSADGSNWTMVRPMVAGGAESARSGNSQSSGPIGSGTVSGLSSSATNPQRKVPGTDLASADLASVAPPVGFDPSSVGNSQELPGNSGNSREVPGNSREVPGTDQDGSGTAGQGNGTGAAGSLNSGSNTPPNGGQTSSMAGSSSVTGQAAQTTDPNDPNSQANPNVSIQLGSPDKARHVNPEGDLKPISVGAGKNWAQAKAEGKATPMSRTIQIVATNNKWFVRSDYNPNKFDAILKLDNGPQLMSEELAAAIRKRVDSWGPSVPGGYWVPLVVVEAASDADISVARLERLLEGSGVEIKVVPLQIPK